MPRKETIWLRAPSEEDKFGDPLDPPAEWREVRGATVVPRESQDYEQRGSIIISGFMIALPPGTVVSDQDMVKIRGREYVVDGAIGDYGKRIIFYTKRAN